MATKAVNALAKRGLEIKKEMERLQNELAGINSKIIEAGEGVTIELDLGRVTVTRTTEARSSGTFELTFDKAKFLAMPTDHPLRIDMMSSGITYLAETVIGGRKSVVQYSLKG